MSTAEEGWELTVPDDAHELAAELRRHGIKPGQRLHFDVIQSGPDESRSDGENRHDGAHRKHRKFGFIGSIDGGPSDLSTNTDDYLNHGFGC